MSGQYTILHAVYFSTYPTSCTIPARIRWALVDVDITVRTSVTSQAWTRVRVNAILKYRREHQIIAQFFRQSQYIATMQVPLTQGLRSHSLILMSHLSPVQPASQPQLKPPGTFYRYWCNDSQANTQNIDYDIEFTVQLPWIQGLGLWLHSLMSSSQFVPVQPWLQVHL